MPQIKSKHKKSKKEILKKHTKKKKIKTDKRKKSRSKPYSSSSDSSSDYEERKNNTETEIEDKFGRQSESSFLDVVLNNSISIVKSEKHKNKSNVFLEQPGQNLRELNPYWKDGGSGLPKPDTNKISEKFETEFKSCSEKRTKDLGGLLYVPKIANSVKIIDNDSYKSQLNFLKPSDDIHFKNKHKSSGNWRKKEYKIQNNKSTEEKINCNEEKSNIEKESVSRAGSSDELNLLSAKIMKAEIMGDKTLINKLKADLEIAKRKLTVISDTKNKHSDKEKVIITDTGDINFKKRQEKTNVISSKKMKVDTHSFKERVRYFPDDDLYSLQNLFEKEKGEENIFKKEENIYTTLNVTNSDELDDAYLEAAASQKVINKNEERRDKKSKQEALNKYKSLEGCAWCLDNRNSKRHLIVSTGSKCYLTLPEEESLTKGHCFIVPIQHDKSTRHLDEDIWEEIKAYQRALTNMFLDQEQDVVFFENARSFKNFPHCFIQCVPLNKELGETAPLYFQKALNDSETEWSQNKKVIDFRNRDLRKTIPKGLPYFAIDFGNKGGFAHIIEDERVFPRNFAEEILGNIMDLDHKKWRKPEKENFIAQRDKALEFSKNWKKYEFNVRISFSTSESESSSD